MTDVVQTTEQDKRDRDNGLTTAELAGAGERPAEAPSFAAKRAVADAAAGDETAAPLLARAETDSLRGRWDEIQASFIDEPRRAVEEADTLVATAMKRLAEVFAAERGALEGQWDRGDDVSTEDLRLALRRYRSFFGRLLSV
jgi:hypothetical protein